MTYINFIYILFALVLCAAGISLVSLSLFKYKTSKVVRCATILKCMTELQYEYYKILSNNGFTKYPEFKKQVEKMIGIYISCLDRDDFTFKYIKVVRKKNNENNEIINRKLLKEIKKIENSSGELKQVFMLNNRINTELVMLKRPIRYRIDVVLRDIVLHILEFIILVLKAIEKNQRARINQKAGIDQKVIANIDEIKDCKYEVAHA